MAPMSLVFKFDDFNITKSLIVNKTVNTVNFIFKCAYYEIIGVILWLAI